MLCLTALLETICALGGAPSGTHGSECGQNRPGFGWQAVSKKLSAIQYYGVLNIIKRNKIFCVVL
jgi:hypothetical protein